MTITLVAIAAFVGTIVAGITGWLAANESWNWRKFATTFVTGIASAVVVAVAAQLPDVIGARDLFIAFLAGAGINVARVNASNAIAMRVADKTPPK